MPRPLRATVDYGALRLNHAVARRHASGARIWSVVKADAYGHGLAGVANALRELTDGFALIEPEGAIALREAGIELPILMLEGFYGADELPLYAEYRLTPCLHALWQVRQLADARLPTRLPVCLKLDTGMHRLGLDADELRQALALLEAADCAGETMLMTHFADADEPAGIDEQMQCLQAMTSGLGLPLCLANSAALLRFPESAGTGRWVRPGIMLYGASPFPGMQSAEAIGLKPVMTLESELIAVRRLQAGDRVGYAGAFVAERPMTIGVVAGGYGDGYPRHAPTGTPIMVGGQRTRTVGRVSMDKLCVDLEGLDRVGVGSTVTLWGGEGRAHLPADDVATAAGTVAYELFCALAGRVPVTEKN